MKRIIVLSLLLGALTGCPNSGTPNAPSTAKHAEDDGHGHGAEKKGHAEGDGHDHAAEKAGD